MRNGWSAAAAAAAAAFVLVAGTAGAQNSMTGYVFGTPGQFRVESFSLNTFHLGGGGEFLAGGVVGVGAEIGYIGPTEEFGEGGGIFSANGSYHFRRKGSVVPYVTAGYSRFFDEDVSMNAVNVGAGFNYWLARRAGLKVEFRDHIHSEDGTTGHYWGVRFGFTFR